MNITFGGGPELDIEELIDTVSSLIGQMAPERLEELRRLNTAEEEKKQTEQKDQLMVCALRFAALEEASQMCKACFKEKLPKSALYRLKDRYYLILDFSDFEKQEMSPFAFSAMEYDDGHISEDVQIAFIVEHGSLIVKNQAVEMLMQL
jgi:negative regulator of genetic competence, sporulation and motility